MNKFRSLLAFAILGLPIGLTMGWTTSVQAQVPSSVMPTTTCRHPDFPQELQCGQILRPLDPAKPDGKKITVHYVVMPSLDRNKLNDAVFLLAGGPGQSAINVASFGAAVFGKLNRRRDLVFIDQRGTGKSAPLACPALESGNRVLDNAQTVHEAQACMKALQKLPYGDLQMFSTSIAVQDIEAIRVAQNYSAINLVGASYGTRVGLEYLRQYPHSVRRLVIDGVVPPDLDVLASDAQPALEGIFHECERQPACKLAYPDLAASWQRLLANTPRRVSFLHPLTGREISAQLSREDIISLIFKSLYSPSLTAALPYAITQAEKGNFSALMTMSGAFSQNGAGALTMGMHFTVFCGEAYARPRAPHQRSEFESVMGDLYDRVCAQWPRANIPDGFFTIPVSASPVLLLSGGIDPVTPTRNGDLVAKALGPKARHLSIDNAGHGLLAQGCVRDVMTRFLGAKDDQDAIGVDATCVRQIPRPLAWMPAKNGMDKNEGAGK